MPVICKNCNKVNPDEESLCINCGEPLAPAEEKYSAPLKHLKEVTRKILRKETPFSKEAIEGLYLHITALLQDILDKARADLDLNFKKLSENIKDLEKEDSTVFENFRKFSNEFSSAQVAVNDGLKMLGDVFKVSSFADIGRNKTKLEFAAARIQEGLERLEDISAITSDEALMSKPLEPVPDAVIFAIDCLERVLGKLNDYIEKRGDKELKDARDLLDLARFYIGSMVSEASPSPSKAEKGEGEAGEENALTEPAGIEEQI